MKIYKKINFIDYNISHAETWKHASIMCGCRVPKDLMHNYYTPPNNIWLKKCNNFFEDEVNSGISVFTDHAIVEVNKYRSQHKVALILEPPIEARGIYEKAVSLQNKFEIIFTFRKKLIEKNPEKFKFMPADFVTLEDDAHKIHTKNKLISMIYSGMRGHNRDLRHQVGNILSDKITLFGGGSPSGDVPLKSDTLKDYMFSVVIENSKPFDYYFTEKILDCFITGNIPIYNGSPSIGDFFDKRGFLTWSSIDELANIIDSISEDKYYEMLPYVKINYELAKKYVSADDVMSDLIYEALHNKTINTMERFIYKNWSNNENNQL